MTWSLSFDPLVPTVFVIVFAAIGAALVLGGLVRRVRGAVVRALAVAALAVALLNPSLREEIRTPLSSVVAVVVDESQSQTIGERAAETDQIREQVVAELGAIDGLEVRTVVVGRDGGAQADGTELFAAAYDALSDVPPDRVGGALFITDGQVHDAPGPDAEAGIAGPVHGLITGREGEIDRRIVLERVPRFGLVNSTPSIALRVEDRGGRTGATAELTVRRDGEEIETRWVPVGQTVRIPVEIAHGGNNIFEFDVEPRDDELSDVNNQAVAIVDGVRDNLRVLLVSGEPHAGERTWRNLLKSDASVDLVHFTILRPPEKQDGTPINELSLIAFPTRELFSEKIDEFDLIVFDRYHRRNVLPSLYFDNIAQYIRNGGAVLVAAGPDYANLQSIYYTPLADVLPGEPSGQVLEEPYYPEVSELGERHPVTRDLPGAAGDPPDWSRWFRLVDAMPTTGDTIMVGPEDRPLLQLARQDEGRIALMLSDHVWLWARGYEGGGPHVPLLRRLAHWLMKEPELEEEALRLSSEDGDLVVERQTLGDEVAPVTVTAPGGEEQEVVLEAAEPGLWRARVPVDEVGLYRAADGDKTAITHVGPPNPREIADLRSTTERMQPAADATGGSVRRVADAGSIDLPSVSMRDDGERMGGVGWIGLKRSSASSLEGVQQIPLFSGFLGLAVLLGAIGATWYREGR
ncbi:hypothetical protein [Amorphus orientalis]|uniref:Glutamine amidotransferase domain-containing protein n=1 Tax=Amorphus orientalis TaxID=649198 RepID=A0AAE3VKU1_9HYPH|nr:hypothetical protein [Amorphus orientalis]MDQ0313891.1 hypothetical protein [Amorphus orientalis]